MVRQSGMLALVGALGLAASLVVAGPTGAATAGVGECDKLARLFPGLPLRSWYHDVRSQVPAAADCDREDGDCKFVDRFGVENSFDAWEETEFDRRDRLLTAKMSYRKAGGWLPYGVKWTDSFKDVAAKARPYGGRPDGTSIRTSMCPAVEDGGVQLWFYFTREGQLHSVGVFAERFP